MRKKIITSGILILTFITFIKAQEIKITHRNDYSSRKDITLNYCDTDGRKFKNESDKTNYLLIQTPVGLDLHNTICDTLFYQGKTILLDESPLNFFREFPVAYLSEDRMYKTDNIRTWAEALKSAKNKTTFNCDRGFTATWTIEMGKIYLTSIHAFAADGKSNQRLTTDLLRKKVEKVTKSPWVNGKIMAYWMNGQIRGGEDCFPSIYGYAYKNEYVLNTQKGVVNSCVITSIPVGKYESEENLKNYLVSVFWDSSLIDLFSKLKKVRKIADDEWAREDLTFYLNPKGKAQLYLPKHTRQEISEGRLDFSKDESAEGRRTQSRLNYINGLPERSIYGRFLKGGVLFTAQIYEIEYTFNRGLKIYKMKGRYPIN